MVCAGFRAIPATVGCVNQREKINLKGDLGRTRDGRRGEGGEMVCFWWRHIGFEFREYL